MMKMKAIRIHSYGGPEVMQLEELPVPVPGLGQALVRVQAASVNFLDVQHRRGDLVNQAFYKKEGAVEYKLPATIGSQCVGIVESLGPGDSPVQVGDRVICGGGSGTYATHVIAPVQRLIPVPDELRLEHAAAGLTQGFLAYALTHAAYPVKPGDWCLIQWAGIPSRPASTVLPPGDIWRFSGRQAGSFRRLISCSFKRKARFISTVFPGYIL